MTMHIPSELRQLNISQTPLPDEDEHVMLMRATGMSDRDARLLYRLDVALQELPAERRHVMLERIAHLRDDGAGRPPAPPDGRQ